MRRTMRTIAIMACGWLAFVASCSVESGGTSGRPNSTADGGSKGPPPGAGNEDAEATLVIEGDSVVLLAYGEQVELTVVLTDSAGEPDAEKAIVFDLLGRPEDSTLSALTVETDSEGRASVTLQAATRPVNFEVQASYDDARPVTFSVSVRSNGFGSLLVHAPYDGPRAVEERFVFALPAVSCQAAEHAAGDPKTVLPPDENSALLIALPAALAYAVVAIAESATGEVVARGCTDMVVVPEQGEDEVSIMFVDQPLVPEQQLDLVITLEAGTTAATLGATIRRSVGELLSASGKASPRDAEGYFWLDAFTAALRDDGDADLVALADALAAARLDPAGGSPENELTNLLQRRDEGASAVASALAARVREALDTLVLSARVGFESGRTPLFEVESLQIEALPVYEGAGAPRVVLDESKTSISATLPGGDVLEITELALAPGLGSLGAGALRSALDASSAELGLELSATAGCEALHQWYAQQTYVDETVCDAACLDRACAYAFDQITTAADDALHAIDEERPLATLYGSLSLTDSDGDLRAEKMETERIDGTWAPALDASLGETLRGRALATVP